MEYTNQDVHAYQILSYLVMEAQYQIVTVQNQKQDFWLMNPSNAEFPVIRICSDNDAQIEADMDYMRNVHRAILDIIKREGKLCLMSTAPAATSLENEYVIQIVVQPGRQLEARLEKEFPGISKAAADMDNPQEACARMMRTLENVQLKKSKEKRSMLAKLTMPKMTMGIVVFALLVYFAVQYLSFTMGNILSGVVAGGAYYKINIVGMQEYWRLITGGFLHVNVFQLLINSYALLNIGILCEKAFKKWQYLLIFTGSMFMGNLFSLIGDAMPLTLGMSTGVYGLMGAFIIYLMENQTIRHPIIRSSIIRLVFVNLILMLMPQVSMIAHVGAFISGAFLGMIFIQTNRWAYLKIHFMISFSVLLVVSLYFGLQVKNPGPIDKEADKLIVESYRNIGWNSYADALQQSYEALYEKEAVK